MGVGRRMEGRTDHDPLAELRADPLLHRLGLLGDLGGQLLRVRDVEPEETREGRRKTSARYKHAQGLPRGHQPMSWCKTAS